MQRLARAHVVPEALLAALNGPLGGAIATAAEYAGSALSEATKRAYARDWFHFAAWCREQAVDPGVLPVHPVLVAAYLASLAGTLGRSALNGRLAAIAHEHRRRGLAWNAGHPAIRETLQGVGRKHGKPVRPAAALTSVEIKQLLETCPDNLAGLRDRALFLVGFAGALRRSELVAIDHDHLRFEAGGVTVHIPRSKRDQEGKGADVTLPRMRDAAGAVSGTCPVQALEQWLGKARIRYGAVFRGCQYRLNPPQMCRLKIPQFVTVQSRPYPRGGSISARSDRSRSTMAWSASAAAVSRRLSGRASAQAAYSACKASSSATAACQRCGLVRRSAGRR